MKSCRIREAVITGAMTASMVLAQGGFDGPGRYEITNLKSGKVLDMDRNDQTSVIQFSPRGTDNQRWDVQPAGGGFFYFRNSMNGKALQISRNSNSAPLECARLDGNPNQQWRIDRGKDGNALIVSRVGKTVDVPDGSSRDGLRLQIYDLNGDSNQRFIFRRVGGGGPPMLRPEQPREDRGGRFFDDREQMWKLAGDGVCFYPAPDFRGEAFCTSIGNDVDDAGRDVAFASVKFFGRARMVEVFERRDFRGDRIRIDRDERDLRRRVGSFRVN